MLLLHFERFVIKHAAARLPLLVSNILIPLCFLDKEKSAFVCVAIAKRLLVRPLFSVLCFSVSLSETNLKQSRNSQEPRLKYSGDPYTAYVGIKGEAVWYTKGVVFKWL